jgi:hypothetical protein
VGTAWDFWTSRISATSAVRASARLTMSRVGGGSSQAVSQTRSVPEPEVGPSSNVIVAASTAGSVAAVSAVAGIWRMIRRSSALKPQEGSNPEPSVEGANGVASEEGRGMTEMGLEPSELKD